MVFRAWPYTSFSSLLIEFRCSGLRGIFSPRSNLSLNSISQFSGQFFFPNFLLPSSPILFSVLESIDWLREERSSLWLLFISIYKILILPLLGQGLDLLLKILLLLKEMELFLSKCLLLRGDLLDKMVDDLLVGLLDWLFSGLLIVCNLLDLVF